MAKQIKEMEQFEQNEVLIQKLSGISSELPKYIKEFNDTFFKSETRYNYTTPKSFIELVKYFQELIERKDDDIINQKQYLEKGLIVVSNASESIAGLKKELELNQCSFEEEKKNISEVLSKLEIENKKISEEKAIIEKELNEAIEESAQAVKDKEEADKAFAEAELAKIAARNEAENIKKDELERFKNPNNPSRNNFLIFKLMYLIFNPEDKVPGDDIKKELPNIRKKCLNQSAAQIKRKMISLLDNISWITPEFLEKVRMYREYPYTDLNQMENISRACKGVISYFQNLVIYKRLYDIVDPLMKKSQQSSQTAAAAMKKKVELEKKLELVSGTQRKLEKEFNESKAKIDKVQEEQNKLLKKLEIAEKFIGILASINERWKKDVEILKSD